MLNRILRTEKIKVLVYFFQLIQKLLTEDDRVDLNFKVLSSLNEISYRKILNFQQSNNYR